MKKLPGSALQGKELPAQFPSRPADFPRGVSRCGVRQVWRGAVPRFTAKTVWLVLGLAVGWVGVAFSAQARALPQSVEPPLMRKESNIAGVLSMGLPDMQGSFMAAGSGEPFPLLPAALGAGQSYGGMDFLEGLNPWRVVGAVQSKAMGKAAAMTSRPNSGIKPAPAETFPELSATPNRHGFEGSGADVIVNRTKMQALLGGNGALIEARMDEVEWISPRIPRGGPNGAHRVRLNFGGPVSIEIDQAGVDALIGEGGMISVDGERIAMDAHVAGSAAALAINHAASRPARVLARGKNGEFHLLANRDSASLAGATPSSRAALAAPASQLPLRAEGVPSRTR